MSILALYFVNHCIVVIFCPLLMLYFVHNLCYILSITFVIFCPLVLLYFVQFFVIFCPHEIALFYKLVICPWNVGQNSKFNKEGSLHHQTFM